MGPREPSGIVGVALLAVILAFGFTGYVLPWEVAYRGAVISEAPASISCWPPGRGADAVLPLRKVEIRRLFEKAARDYPPKAELAFLLQSMEDPRNVGSLFRVADAVGARELVLAGRTPAPPDEEIDRTSRGHDRRVPWRVIADTQEAMRALREEGYHMVALETARGARCFLDYPWTEKVCLVLGNESKGVYPATLGLCDGAVFVPMYGKGPSMNVHVAAALVAYEAVLRGGEAG